MKNLSEMTVNEIKSYIEENKSGAWGFNLLKTKDIEKLAKENDLVKVHGFSLNTSDDYQDCANDKDFVHFVEDVNGYVQGVNVDYRSTQDCPYVEKIQH